MCCMKQVLQCFIVLFQMLKQSRTELLYLCHTILQFYSSQVCSSAPQVTHHWKSTFVLGQDSINQNLGMEWTSASMVMKWSGFLMLLTIPPICTCPNHRPASKRFDHQPRWCPPLETSTCVFSIFHQKYTRYILILVFFPVGHDIFCVRNMFKNQHVNKD